MVLIIVILGCGHWKEPSQWDGSFEHPSFPPFFFSQIYPTKKETHHLELFNSQEDHKL